MRTKGQTLDLIAQMSAMGGKQLSNFSKSFAIRPETSDSSLKNSWAAYGPGNSNHLEVILTELKDP